MPDDDVWNADTARRAGAAAEVAGDRTRGLGSALVCKTAGLAPGAGTPPGGLDKMRPKKINTGLDGIAAVDVSGGVAGGEF